MAGCVGRAGDFGLRRWVRYGPESNLSHGTRRPRDRGVSHRTLDRGIGRARTAVSRWRLSAALSAIGRCRRQVGAAAGVDRLLTAEVDVVVPEVTMHQLSTSWVPRDASAWLTSSASRSAVSMRSRSGRVDVGGPSSTSTLSEPSEIAR
jgi:hypothetical protein